MYNKNNLRVAKVAKEGSIQPALASVLFTGLHTVATDSFRLIEMSVPNGEAHEPVLLNAKQVGKIKATDKDMIVITKDGTIKTPEGTYSPEKYDADTYPKYEQIFPTETPVLEIHVDATYLESILAILKRVHKFEHVKMSLYGVNKPIVIEAKGDEQSARAMLMPIMQ